MRPRKGENQAEIEERECFELPYIKGRGKTICYRCKIRRRYPNEALVKDPHLDGATR